MGESLAMGLDFVFAANGALLLAVGLLWVATYAVQSLGYGRDWTLRRRLTGMAWGLALFIPVAVLMSPWLFPAASLNATDILVAQYLRGNIAISATDLSSLLALRDNLPRAILTPTGPVWQAIAILLVTAALIRGGYVVASAWRLRAILVDATAIRRTRAVTIYLSETCTVPFAARGLTRYHVVLPVYLAASPRAFRIALAHELQHIRQGDPLLEVAVAVLSPLFVLNPAFWSLARQTRRLREHDCDAACIARPGGDARDYSITLLSVAAQATRTRRAPGTFSVQLLGRRQMDKRATRTQLGHRIELLAKAPRRSAGVIASVAILGLFGTTMAGGLWMMRAPTDWSQERLELSSVLNLERLETINTLSQRPLR